MSKHINIYYGPVNSFNLGIAHKPQLIYGLRDRLRKLGYRVDLKPVEYVNYCMLEMCGYEIFKCNIKYLCCNMPYKKDPIAQLALKAVKESSQKFYNAQTYFWLKEFINKHFLKMSEHAYKDHWLSDIPQAAIREMADFSVCAQECCGILLNRGSVQDEKLPSGDVGEIILEAISKAFSHGDTEAKLNDNTRSKEQRIFETI